MLSSPLSHLSSVGLIKGERQSRFIHYFAEYETMDELISFLPSNSRHSQIGEAILTHDLAGLVPGILGLYS